MGAKWAAIAGTLTAVLATAGCGGQMPMAAATQPAMTVPVVHEVPQAIRRSHADVLERLTALSRRRGAVGVEAGKALVLIKAHFQREEDYIMPPLSLAHALADGKVSADMRWAVVMADRIKADREVIFEEHTKITDAMNALLAVATRAHDKDAMEFANDGVTDSFEDMEINEPLAIVIGDYLRLRLPPQ